MKTTGQRQQAASWASPYGNRPQNKPEATQKRKPLGSSASSLEKYSYLFSTKGVASFSPNDMLQFVKLLHDLQPKERHQALVNLLPFPDEKVNLYCSRIVLLAGIARIKHPKSTLGQEVVQFLPPNAEKNIHFLNGCIILSAIVCAAFFYFTYMEFTSSATDPQKGYSSFFKENTQGKIAAVGALIFFFVTAGLNEKRKINFRKVFSFVRDQAQEKR
jgi:hypothetical protein